MILGLVGPLHPATSPDISPCTGLDRQNLSPSTLSRPPERRYGLFKVRLLMLIGYLLPQDPGTHGAPSGSTLGDFPRSTFLQLGDSRSTGCRWLFIARSAQGDWLIDRFDSGSSNRVPYSGIHRKVCIRYLLCSWFGLPASCERHYYSISHYLVPECRPLFLLEPGP